MTFRSLGVGAGAVIAALAVATPAHAATGTWAGSVTGTTGKIALDGKVNRQGFVTKIKQIRVKDVPSQCEVTGPATVGHTFPATLRIQNGGFGGTYTQPTYGNQTTIDGRFNRSGRKITGTIQINYHYLEPPPEENCDTGPLAFKVKLGATDETGARPAAQRLTY